MFQNSIQKDYLASVPGHGLSTKRNHCTGSAFPSWLAVTVSKGYPDESSAVMRKSGALVINT
jgi:hypothetical protein